MAKNVQELKADIQRLRQVVLDLAIPDERLRLLAEQNFGDFMNAVMATLLAENIGRRAPCPLCRCEDFTIGTTSCASMKAHWTHTGRIYPCPVTGVIREGFRGRGYQPRYPSISPTDPTR